MARERFEEALNKLEKIVSKLEKGDLPLEDSLKLFEEGIRLSRFCNQKLDEAERRVDILVKDRNGTLKPQPFEPLMNSDRIHPEQIPSEQIRSGQIPSTNPTPASSTVPPEQEDQEELEDLFSEKTNRESQGET